MFHDKKIEQEQYEEFLFLNKEPANLKSSHHSDVTWKGFRDFRFIMDKFVVQEYRCKWPLDKKTYLGQAKTRHDYGTHNLKANNISLEDTIGPQRSRAVLGLDKLDKEYLMNI